ncbi:MAG: fumarylacetoacetate hydrolase family protein, partial [Acidobacteriota bacterium]
MLDAGQLPTSAGDLFKIPDLKGWLAAGREAFEVAGQIKQFAESAARDVPWKLSRTQIRIVAPISNPGKIVAIGLNYKDHAREQNVALPEKPLIFAKFPTSIIGHDEPIKLPA